MSDETMMPTAPAAEELDLEPIVLEELHANMTAIGSAEAATLVASQSALGNVSVEGDAEVSASAVGGLSTIGSAAVRQSIVGAIMSDGEASLSQGMAPLIMAKRVDMSTSGACVVAADDVSVTKSWIGLMAARNATLSEDSRVVIDWRAALIIGALLMGGFAIVAVGVFLAGRRIADALGRATDKLPDLHNLPHMPDLSHLQADLPAIIARIAKMRRAAA
jgi:hypothetical protein